MEFDNSFEVPLAPAQTWRMLMDIGRIAPCMPGAELTEIIDALNYKGKISVRLGPVALAFAGNVQLADVDEANRAARVIAQGNDAKGRGSANAAATFRIEPSGDGSRVLIHTDLVLAGAVAQYGRGVGMIQATAAQIIGQFAANLRAQLAQHPAISAAPAQSPKPARDAASVAAAQASPAFRPQQARQPAVSTAPAQSPKPARDAAPAAAAVPLSPTLAPSPGPAAKPIAGLSLMARVIWQQLIGLFSRRGH